MSQLTKSDFLRHKARCAACGGTGSSRNDPVCQACHGNREVTFILEIPNPPLLTCPVCRGKGETPSTFYCPRCAGIGVVPVELKWQKRYH